MTTYKTFETERLIMRPTTEEDASFIFELVNTPKWLQYIGDRNVRSVDDAKVYINNKMRPQLEKLGYGNYMVIRKSDHTKIGTCSLYKRETLPGVDIGFAFLPQFERKGFAYEAARKLRDVAFREFQIPELFAITIKENISSQKLLEKLGLKFQKIIRLPDDDEDLMLYTLSGNDSRYKIQERLECFARSFDSKEWDIMKDCLADEIFIDYSSFRNTEPSYIYKDEYIQLRKDGLKKLVTSHRYLNYEIEASENLANCKCDFEIRRYTEDEGDFYHSFGKYEFGLSKIHEEWKISKIIQHIERNEGNPDIHGAFKRTRP